MELGETLLIVGMLRYVNTKAEVTKSTPLLATDTDTLPGAAGGAVQAVRVTATKEPATRTFPKRQVSSTVERNPVPVTVTNVPPRAGPDVMDSDVTVGKAAHTKTSLSKNRWTHLIHRKVTRTIERERRTSGDEILVVVADR
jgi:hypothetical protein